MRKFIIFCLLALLFANSFANLGIASGMYTVKLSPEGGLQLDPGKSYTLKALIEPVNLIEHVLTWSSDNDYVATVNSSGVVTAHAAGRTVIRVTLETGARASCYVTVSGRAVTELEINEKSVELGIGKSLQLTYTMNQDAEDKRVKWSTDDKRVATVSNEGLVTAVGYGTAVITLLAVNGTVATASVFVPSDVQNIMLDPESAMIAQGATLALDAYVFPGNARNRDIIWESSDKRIVTVDQDGVVTGVSIGSATVRASTQNGVHASAQITVAKLPTSLALSDTRVLLSREHRTHDLSVYIEPATARDCVLTWESSNTNVVAVRGGRLTAQGYGAATVSVRAQNGLSVECHVTVAETAEAIALTKSEYTLFAGGAKVALEYQVTPEHGYADDLEWKVDDANIARVDENGDLYGVSKGETRVTVTAPGGVSASAKVNVYEDARYIELSAQSLSVNTHASALLSASCGPDETQGVQILWASANNEIAVVREGVVYGRAPGETVICAYTADGALRAECALTVIDSGDKAPKRIALTFDNGPGEATPAVLDTLSAYGVRATFFLCGRSIEKYPDIAILYADTPHELGNHTYNNKSLNNMSLADVALSIEKTDELIVKATGRQASVLRAPDANLPAKLFNSFLDARRFVGWSSNVGDTLAGATKQSICDSALAGAFDTAIPVFHDSSARMSEALEDIIIALIMDGYEFVTVSELMDTVSVPGNVFVTGR